MSDYEYPLFSKELRPARTRLAHLEPIGVGGIFTEGLPNFIARLADLHRVSVSTLIISEIAPLIGNDALIASLKRGSSRFYERCYALLNSSNCFLLIAALEKLTGQSDLHYMTFMPWSVILDCRGIFRRFRAVCPFCLSEWKSNGLIVSEPLLWSLSPVTECPIHSCDIQLICPHCNRSSPAMSRSFYPGHCSRCGRWLGLKDVSAKSGHPPGQNLSFAGWCAHALGQMIAKAPTLSYLPTKNTLRENFSAYLLKQYNCNASYFSRDFSLPEASVKRWIAGKCLPNLPNLFQICYLTDTNPLDFILSGIMNHRDRNRSTPQPKIKLKNRSREALNLDKVALELDKILRTESSCPPSMSAVAKRLNLAKKTLYDHFRDTCKAISARASADRESHRRKNLKQMSLFVENTVEQLLLKGIYPSYKKVESLSNRKGILRGKEARTVWRNRIESLRLWD